MNTDALLQRYNDRFVTYGNRDGRLWFLDFEDDRLMNMETVSDRLSTWKARGSRSNLRIGALDGFDKIEDQSIFDTRRAGGPPLHQPYSVKSRIALGMSGPMIEPEMMEKNAVRIYQATKLGTLRGETCLIDLFPVPFHPTSMWWDYDTGSQLPWMASSKAMKSMLLVPRLERVREIVMKHQPQALVTFCRRYRDTIEQVLKPSSPMDIVSPEGRRYGARTVEFGRIGKTLLVITDDRRLHRSPPNAALWRLGQDIAARK